MRPLKPSILIAKCLIFSLLFMSCTSGHKGSQKDDTAICGDSAEITEILTEEKDTVLDLSSASKILDYLNNTDDSLSYRQGIIPVMAREVPEYAAKLIRQIKDYDNFIVVDKASMRVILYDKFGRVDKSYDMACAKNFGTKHKKADSRTPEGFFSVEGIYDSTDWLFTDDWGNTSKKKGQFGPRFIRLKIPRTSQIGIHGTCSPWSIGHRVSHGCIRILNENILELVEYAKPGMPVIVLPGKRDRAVNRSEGYDIPYFPTDEKYAMSHNEKLEKINPVKFDEIEKDESKDEGLETDDQGLIEMPENTGPEETESVINEKENLQPIGKEVPDSI